MQVLLLAVLDHHFQAVLVLQVTVLAAVVAGAISAVAVVAMLALEILAQAVAAAVHIQQVSSNPLKLAPAQRPATTPIQITQALPEWAGLHRPTAMQAG